MIARAKEMTSAAIEAAARKGAGRRGQCAETISRGGVSRALVSSADEAFYQPGRGEAALYWPHQSDAFVVGNAT